MNFPTDATEGDVFVTDGASWRFSSGVWHYNDHRIRGDVVVRHAVTLPVCEDPLEQAEQVEFQASTALTDKKRGIIGKLFGR